MPLETATYISQLNTANPAHSDQLNQADSHLRLLKATIQATFPNFTAAALTSTQAQLDAAVSATTNGVSVLADAGAFFKTNTTDGVTNPAAGQVDIKVNGVSKLSVTSAGISGNLIGVGSVPIGMPCPWFEDTLPDAAYGDYAWLNGQVITSANTRCPVLLARWTNRFGGNGTTTMGVPDTREVALYGKSTMGGTTTPGRITNYVLTTLGAFIGACTVALSAANIAAHTHTVNITTGTDYPDHTHNFTAGFAIGACPFSGGSPQCANSTSTTAGANSRHQHDVNGNTGTGTGLSGTAHDNVSPGMVCNWVVRLA